MKRKVLAALCALGVGLALSANEAEAQSFRLNRFRSAERADDGFGVRRLGPIGHLRFGALLTGDYANDPLVLERSLGNDFKEVRKVVEHELTLKLDLSLGLWDRVVGFVSLEAVPLLKGRAIAPGFGVPGADGAGMGDLAFGGRLRLVGEADDMFGLGVQATVIVPTAGSQAYRGEDSVAFRPEIIAELRPNPVRITANVGTLVRKGQQLLNTSINDDLLYGLGLGVRLHETTELIGELGGAFSYKDFGKRSTTDVNWLAGFKLRSRSGFYFAAAGGTGLTHGIGTPDARVIGQLGFLQRQEKEPAPRPAEVPPPAPPPPDRDGDGLPDASDGCPDEAEDRDGFQDENGCPDHDNDEDGVLDTADTCPNEAEDKDGFEDENGCPDNDNDQDGVADAEDACRDVKGVPEEKGCPEKVRLTEQGELIIREQILFETNKAVILPESFPIMEAVQAMLEKHPEINKVRIEGHTDSTGNDQKNLRLSQQRAASVGLWLAEHGIDRRRLMGTGCGEKHPVAEEDSESGKAQNRRVLFQVTDPVPPDGREKQPAGCRPIPIPAPKAARGKPAAKKAAAPAAAPAADKPAP